MSARDDAKRSGSRASTGGIREKTSAEWARGNKDRERQLIRPWVAAFETDVGGSFLVQKYNRRRRPIEYRSAHLSQPPCRRTVEMFLERASPLYVQGVH
jgi:hypothetical protein